MRSAMTSMALATASACEATAGTTLPSSAFIKWTNSMAVSSSRLAESGLRFGLEMVHGKSLKCCSTAVPCSATLALFLPFRANLSSRKSHCLAVVGLDDQPHGFLRVVRGIDRTDPSANRTRNPLVYGKNFGSGFFLSYSKSSGLVQVVVSAI